MSTVNLILDVVLIVAAVWMIVVIRGIGGVVRQSLNWITIGAVVLGIAHLLATGIARFAGPDTALGLDSATQGMIHRVVVLLGFVLLALGFNRISKIA